MANRDYSEEEDYYSQGFESEGIVSIWLGLSVPDSGRNADVLQDYCGVGYYDLDQQDGNSLNFEDVPIEMLLQDLSYASSYLPLAVRKAQEIGVLSARWVIAQHDFEYDPTKVRRAVASDPVFLGAFPYRKD